MYRPNLKCKLFPVATHDISGQQVPGKAVEEPCCLISAEKKSFKSNTRQDLSGSQTAARELRQDLLLLVGPKTVAKIEGIVEVVGIKFRITGLRPRINLAGRLDHYELLGEAAQGT